jgi:serine protease Do
VKRTMEYILKKGRPVHGYLGLETRDLNNYLRSVFNYRGQGVVVKNVTPGSPADLAGLKPYDIITAYQGEGVQSMKGFLNRVKRSEVESEATISVWRVNNSMNLTAEVGEANLFGVNEQIPDSGRLASDDAILNTIGLAVRNLPLGARVRGGVLVTKVAPGSLGAKVGVQPNDFLLEINGARIRNDQDFYLRLVATAAVKPTEIRVIRENTSRIVTIPAIPRTKGPTD